MKATGWNRSLFSFWCRRGDTGAQTTAIVRPAVCVSSGGRAMDQWTALKNCYGFYQWIMSLFSDKQALLGVWSIIGKKQDYVGFWSFRPDSTVTAEWWGRSQGKEGLYYATAEGTWELTDTAVRITWKVCQPGTQTPCWDTLLRPIWPSGVRGDCWTNVRGQWQARKLHGS